MGVIQKEWFALTEWGKTHKTNFFKIYASMHPKKLKTTVENRHEDFVFAIMEVQRRELEEKGKPVLLIDAPCEEIPANTVVTH